MRRPRGSGSIYKMANSRNWWIKFTGLNGEPVRESSGGESKEAAKSLLKKRFAEIHQGIDPRSAARLLYEDLRTGLLDFYTSQNRKGLHTYKTDDPDGRHKKGEKYVHGLPNLDAFFSGWKVSDITTAALKQYAEKRRGNGADNGTIKREFNTLRSAMNLVRKEGGMQFLPYFPMPKENAPVGQYMTPEQFIRIRAKLPEHLHLLVTYLYYTGSRLGEAKAIRWYQVNLDERKITLEHIQTKNGEPRMIPLDFDDGLVSGLKKRFRINDGPVFDSTNLRKEWTKAVKGEFGNKNLSLRIHDLRVTSVTDMTTAGVDRDVAKSISGHRTDAVFARYNITHEKTQHEAAKLRGKIVKVKVRQSSGVPA
jgi:integrase